MALRLDDRRLGRFAIFAFFFLSFVYLVKHMPSSVSRYTIESIPKAFSPWQTATSEESTPLTTKSAVIIAARPKPNLIPLILHFSSVLGPSWPIIIYTASENIGTLTASAALQRYINLKLIIVRTLPQTVLFTNSDSVSSFLTKPWLWEDLAPAEHILIFQSDSMLCANAARSVDDFFEYDFVGAPIGEAWGQGYNGGLSLRKRSTMLRVIREFDWEKYEEPRHEDQWYYARMLELKNGNYDDEDTPPPRIVLPSMEVARTFAVETIDYPHPLGVHQVLRHIENKYLSMDEWCPEYKLCSDDYIVNDYGQAELEEEQRQLEGQAKAQEEWEEKQKGEKDMDEGDDESKERKGKGKGEGNNMDLVDEAKKEYDDGAQPYKVKTIYKPDNGDGENTGIIY